MILVQQQGNISSTDDATGSKRRRTRKTCFLISRSLQLVPATLVLG